MKTYFDQDGITIYHSDCKEAIPLLDSVDHVITDPPYSEQVHAGARSNSGHHGKTRKMQIEKLINFNSISYPDLYSVFSLFGPKVKRWVVSFMDWEYTAQMKIDPPLCLDFIRFGVWVKGNSAPQFTGDRPGTGWESIAILHNRVTKKKWNGGGRHGVWLCPILHQANRVSNNPTEKPVKLVEDFILQFTDPGDLILDPFMGSGTTLDAARRLNRRAIGIDLDESQCEQAAIRMSQRLMDLTL